MMRPKQHQVAIGLVVFVVLVWVRGLLAPSVRSGRPPRAAARAVSGEPHHAPPAAPVPPAAPGAPLSPDELSPTRAGYPARSTVWADSPFLVERRTAPRAVPQETSSPAPVAASAVSLQGIFWDAQATSALVNNQLVKVGDHVDGWEVVEIHDDQVIVANGAVRRTLTLK